MELRNTVEYMISTDYKDRFVAEYYQLKIRYEKLKDMCDKWDEGELSFTPTCERKIYNSQLKAMRDYMEVLEKRAIIENVSLILEDDNEYKKIVDKCVEECKAKRLNWVNWNYFKDMLKGNGLAIDFRSSQGRRIVSYAKEKWRTLW